MTQAIYDAAEAHLGLQEWPGSRHNPTIVEFAETVGHGWVQDDETPWCASFVGAVLAQLGLPHTGQLNARSYLTWGEEVPLEQARKGDVVVFWRVDPNSWQGHVGFYAGRDSRGNILVLGGNQGNKVSIAPYGETRLLSVRRLRQPRASLAESTTMQAGSVQLGTAGTGAVTAVAALDGQAQIIALVIFGVIALAAVWIMRERIKKWARGIR
jgi:uncharacterized protein (TIGR02594 family)